ncbi:MAG: dynamin family protein [Cytophagales bacterium]|nr:dynamin family protein [Cytophagales bacterium]
MSNASPHTTIQSQFNQHQAWCLAFAKRLTALAEWLEKNTLADSVAYAEVNRLRYQLSSQQVMVAVIAEFSRGKSELINALFFANYGKRIMPAGAGRTTMCPAEMSWNPALPVGIRLLPIETRKEKISLAHWRVRPESWVSFAFDTQDPEAMAQTISKVGEVQRVSVQEATRLGFWLPDGPNGERNFDNPVPDRLGQVEVPVWRHACINIPHPLLKQGLVILDTPGLNAVGVEPDLTMALLGQAQATLFVLGADTGVTKSDLDLWREHLNHAGATHIPRYAVLNKIDTLWDDLKTPAEVITELEKQCQSTAQLLSIGRQSVVAVSAQKGLLAKIKNDAELLARSGLPELEALLGSHLVMQRQTIIQQNCMSGMRHLQNAAARKLEQRYQSVAQHIKELQTLAGQNAQESQVMQDRLTDERQAVERAATAFTSLKDLCVAGAARALIPLSALAMQAHKQSVEQALQGGLLGVGMRAGYEKSFDRLQLAMQKSQGLLTQLHAELVQKTQTINTRHGFALAIAPSPLLTQFADTLRDIRLAYLQHLTLGNRWRWMSKDYSQRIGQTLHEQVQSVVDAVRGEVERWAKNTELLLTTELAERQHNLAKREASIAQANDAPKSMAERLSALDAELEAIRTQGKQLVALARD